VIDLDFKTEGQIFIKLSVQVSGVHQWHHFGQSGN